MFIAIMLVFFALTLGGAPGSVGFAAMAAFMLILMICSPSRKRHGIHIELSFGSDDSDHGDD